ncbi:aldehyde dehydrogenase family protein [Gordonia jinghuaiqii]|uniref:Aldehyde dehydrogenase family protein n=1 Tax=Gordonia jinghuaiqii TaxID=2758710 RepID=A0A7D7LT51_9ACTN|nr:aldehyde dehydrogenase family protein [Gordonia jinghuaiqii]MCR5978468.1 aldehyde dehydrogenase family protein [Gordonia jinghuaiqii]QMT02805.1 aldehyde dehydrogenase family protein [Gordonia jinghuaiqii]
MLNTTTPLFETTGALARFGLDSLHSGTYIDGHGWGERDGRPVIDAVSPADGSVVAQVAASDAPDVERAITAAVETQRRWRNVPAPKRGEFVRRIGALVEENLDALAAIVCLDTGKSTMEAKGELREVVDMATLAAGQARMLYGFTQQSQRVDHRMYDQWLPLGVVGVISAYNFPAAVWAQNGFLSVIGGNTVVWKPSPRVPLTAIAIQQLVNVAAAELGCEGVFSLVIPASDDVAEQIVADTRVAMVSFTGSTRVGKHVAQVVGSTLGRRYQLECSGNNGCIVDETADLALAAKAITFGALGTTGQRCTSTRRVIAHRSIVDELVALLGKAFDQITIGDPRDHDTIIGPLIDATAVEDYRSALDRARQQGATVVYGGNVIDRPGLFVEPAIVTGVRPEFEIAQEETFAPIVSVLTYDSLDEAIAIHNDVAQGLASGIHTTNLTNLETFLSARGSDCGIVRVNMGTTGADVGSAFGGEKETGGGRTAGSDAWKGFMRRQSVCVNWGGTSAWDHLIDL